LSSPEHRDELTARKVSRTLGDEADELLASTSAAEIELVARKVRLTALDIRRMLIDSSPRTVAGESLEASADHQLRRMELADLTVEIVNAIDYLLSSLTSSAHRFPQLTLASEGSPGYGQISFTDAALDQTIRKRLDARGAAVRLIMRLFVGMTSEPEIIA
jgi:hypothetical protein